LWGGEVAVEKRVRGWGVKGWRRKVIDHRRGSGVNGRGN